MAWLFLFLAAQLVPRTAADYRQPQIAIADGTMVVTFASERAIYFASSADNGASWRDPVLVAQPAALSLGNHRGPRIAAAGGTLLISYIADGNIVVSRSSDGGKSWQTGATVTDLPKASREGLHAMAASKDGHVFLTWLDLRNLQPGKPGTELWGAYSADRGATWSKNTLVYRSPDGSICTCCHPSAMFDAQGTLLVMWRNALQGNRDMYLARSSDSGRTFAPAEKLGTGAWPLNACPMDGGGLVQNADGKVLTVWRRGKDVYLSPEGRAETMIHEGKNPAIAAGKDGLYLAWSSADGVFARVPGQSEPVMLDHEGGFVTVAAASQGPAVAAWERKGTIQFHTLP